MCISALVANKCRCIICSQVFFRFTWRLLIVFPYTEHGKTQWASMDAPEIYTTLLVSIHATPYFLNSPQWRSAKSALEAGNGRFQHAYMVRYLFCCMV